MHKHLIAAAALIALTACAAQEAPPERWGRADGQPASDADKARFQADESACEWEVAKVQAGAAPVTAPSLKLNPTPQDGLDALASGMANARPGTDEYFALCMGARGWRRTA